MPKPFALTLTCVLILASLCATVTAQELPKATQLPGKPFFVKKTWIIGGEGNWDYLTLDANALQLFIAHGTEVQVVDVNAGTVTGQITGMRDAHGIALNDSGTLGFVSDGGANRVRIFDRESLKVIASAPTGPNPRAIVYEPLTKLVFAICTDPVTESTLAQVEAAAGPSATAGNQQAPQSQAHGPARTVTANRQTARPQGNTEVTSMVSVIDSSTNKTLGHVLVPGRLGYALADGRGEVYITVVDRNRVTHFDAQSVLAQLQQQAGANHAENVPILDWTIGHSRNPQSESRLQWLRLGTDCRDPKSLAIDGDHLRLFAACDNQKLEVLNTGTGEVVTTLTIGPGTDAIGFDASRGLIYTANGGGLGSLTIIRQDVADSYAVIQDLPTKQRARTLAVNPTNGEVYLVTNLEGFNLNKGEGGGAHTLPVVQASPVTGSFQVLVVGN